MTMQRSIHLALAGAIALALFGTSAIATAQPAAQQVPPPPPPPMQPMPPPPPAPPMPPPAPPMQPMPPPAPPMPSQTAMPAGTSAQFYQGTQTTATYALPDSNGGSLTVRSGMPAHVKNYGPPPSFAALDTNHDGKLSEQETTAYPPLESDFLFASKEGKYITRAQYKTWVATQH